MSGDQVEREVRDVRAMRVVRVCLDTSAVPVRPGGAGRYVVDLTDALAHRSDIELTVVCRRGDRNRWTGAGGSVRVIDASPNARPLRLAWEQAGLPRTLGRLDVDVHHSPHYTMPLATRRPVVVTVHDLSFFDHPEWHERTKTVFFRSSIRAAAARAAGIVAVSQATADRLMERLRPRGPVHVIPHGVDHERFRPPGPKAQQISLSGLGQGQPYVAFLGTLEPRKDVPTLVRAFNRIAAGSPELALVLAGAPGWGADAVAEAVAASPFANRILRPGYLREADIVSLLQGAAVVAYPSLEEGFGLPALEAMACGAPLVTTTGSAMEEVAGDAALLVAPGDEKALAGALEACLGGGADVEARRQKGLVVAARHTWAASAEAHMRVYREASGDS